MDDGAHFHKCDFQVHTPRDANWDGDGAVTVDERRKFANEFVRSIVTISLYRLLPSPIITTLLFSSTFVKRR